ncbi:MAG: hypothetical protein EXR79_15730 [Myxococcales bacterium]|nr:hypothetical protein [Myxococcales bacterium]
MRRHPPATAAGAPATAVRWAGVASARVATLLASAATLLATIALASVAAFQVACSGAGQARTVPAVGASDLAKAARAAWVEGRHSEALAHEKAAALRDRTVALDLAAWHLERRQQPEAALRLLGELDPAGCADGAACRVVRSALLRVARPERAFAVRVLRHAPRRPALAGQPDWLRWVERLAGDLMAAGRPTEVMFLLDGARASSPAEPTLWTMLYGLARAHPGAEARAQWTARVAAAGLTAREVGRIAMAVEQAADRMSAIDRAVVGQLHVLASERPDAGEMAWVERLDSHVRAEDRAAVVRIARDHADRLPGRAGQAALARALLAVGALDLAAPIVEALQGQPDLDAVGRVLAADLMRQRGDIAGARTAVAAALTPVAVRGPGALLVAELWRNALPGDADHWLQVAAEAPGPTRLAALRQRAMRALQALRPNALTDRAAVVTYGRALALAGAATDVEGAVARAEDTAMDGLALAHTRRALIRQLEARGPVWTETTAKVLRAFADAGCADADMLRAAGLSAVQTGDVAAFRDLDERARALAAAEGWLLADEPVLKVLTERDRAPILARWLRDAPNPEVGDVELSWKVAHALFASQRAGLGRPWAERALALAPGHDVPLGTLATLAERGAADLVERLTADRPMSEVTQMRTERGRIRVAALVQLDRADEAEQLILALGAGSDIEGRLLRPLLDTAADLGLCRAVAALAPRLAKDSDLYTARTAVLRGLDCARMSRSDAAARAIAAALQEQSDPSRLDQFAREAVARGLYSVGVEAFVGLDRVRPTGDDSLFAWARALLALERTEAALTTLDRMIQMVRGRSARMYDKAAELLEDHGKFDLAARYRAHAVATEPDQPLWRLRAIANQLRTGRRDGLAPALQSLVKLGPTQDDYRNLLAIAERTGSLRALHDAVVGLPDADRELERFRLELAAALGEREAVRMGVRRLRSRGSVPTARAIDWLVAVGALRDAREVAEDVLASPEPVGATHDREGALATALQVRRDPTSVTEALNLARLYVGRALDPAVAAADAAQALNDLGLAREATALGQLAGLRDDPRGLLSAAELELRAGRRNEAIALWERALAGLLLDARLREQLRAWPATYRETMRHDENFLVATVAAEALLEVGAPDVLLRWLDELLGVAPESAFVHGRRMQALLRAGRPEAAAHALAEATWALPTLPADLQPTAERIAREGGGPTLLARFAGDGVALPTESWWLGFARGLIATYDARPHAGLQRLSALAVGLEPARLLIDTLARVHTGARLHVTLAWAAQGDAARARQTLGRFPFARSSGDDEAGRALGIRAAAAVLSLRGPAAYDVESAAPAAADDVRRWLGLGHQADVVTALAAELVRQGQPSLAGAVAKSGASEPAAGAQGDGARERYFVALAGADDAAAAAAGLAMLSGRRGQIEMVPDSRLPSQDELFAQALRAGRVGVAVQLARALQRDEAGLRAPGGLAAPEAANDVTDRAQRLQRFDPQLIDHLDALDEGLPADAAALALALAIAADPARALRIAVHRAARSDEAWRDWLDVVVAAQQWEEPELARTAVRRAAEAGAPGTVLACARLGLLHEGGFAQCVRGRPFAALDADDMGHLAAAWARGVSPEDAAWLQQGFASATTGTQVRFLAAAASRYVGLAPPARDALTAAAGRLVATLAPGPARELVVVGALDDVAALGLGKLAVDVLARWFAHDPDGRGQRNNLAYARLLAGVAPAEVLPAALEAAAKSAGEPAEAVTDTVATALWALGRRDEAILWQRSALVAALRAPARWPRVGLPRVRLAEFLLDRGQWEEARTLAALTLDNTGAEAGSTRPDDPQTLQRARRVVKACVRAERTAATSAPVPGVGPAPANVPVLVDGPVRLNGPASAATPP